MKRIQKLQFLFLSLADACSSCCWLFCSRMVDATSEFFRCELNIFFCCLYVCRFGFRAQASDRASGLVATRLGRLTKIVGRPCLKLLSLKRRPCPKLSNHTEWFSFAKFGLTRRRIVEGPQRKTLASKKRKGQVLWWPWKLASQPYLTFANTSNNSNLILRTLAVLIHNFLRSLFEIRKVTYAKNSNNSKKNLTSKQPQNIPAWKQCQHKQQNQCKPKSPNIVTIPVAINTSAIQKWSNLS